MSFLSNLIPYLNLLVCLCKGGAILWGIGSGFRTGGERFFGFGKRGQILVSAAKKRGQVLFFVLRKGDMKFFWD